MNELLIMGGLFGLLALACALTEAIERRQEIAVWLDSKLTQIHAARIAYKRAKKIKF